MVCFASLHGPNEVLVAGDVVTAAEQAVLANWAEDKLRRGRLIENPRDPGRFLTPHLSATGSLSRFTKEGAGREQDFVWIPKVVGGTEDGEPLDPLPDLFWEIRARVVRCLGLEGVEEDHYKGSFLTYTAPGGAVHQHCDEKVMIDREPCDILRCNVLFQRPESGGLPVIGTTELDVPDRGMWVFYATALVHSAGAVSGSFRGTLSYGFLIRPRQLWERRFRIAANIGSQYGLEEGNDGRRKLIEKLRRAAGTSALGTERLELAEYIIGFNGAFSVREAADAVGREPAGTASDLMDLQRSGFVDSVGSLSVSCGTVIVM